MVDAVNILILVLRVSCFDLLRHETFYNAIKLEVFVVFRLNCGLSIQDWY